MDQKKQVIKSMIKNNALNSRQGRKGETDEVS